MWSTDEILICFQGMLPADMPMPYPFVMAVDVSEKSHCCAPPQSPNFPLGGVEGAAIEKDRAEATVLENEQRVVTQKAEEELKQKKILKLHEQSEVKQEVAEELKRKNLSRIREQTATVFKEGDGVICFSFPEAHPNDLSRMKGGQGFTFDKDRKTYSKRVKMFGDPSGTDKLYDEVRQMGTAALLKPAVSSGSGSGRAGPACFFDEKSEYRIHQHSLTCWNKYANSVQDRQAYLVRRLCVCL